MAKEKAIRIRLTAYEHEILDQSVEKILTVASKTNAKVKGPIPPDRKAGLHDSPRDLRVQGQPRAIRDPHPQTVDLHHQPHQGNGGNPQEARPSLGRRYRHQAIRRTEA